RPRPHRARLTGHSARPPLPVPRPRSRTPRPMEAGREHRAGATFRAMGSDAHVVVVGGPAGLEERARARIAQLERRWSRFIDDSEVSTLNRCAGAPVRVSAETVELVQRAIEAWQIT